MMIFPPHICRGGGEKINVTLETGCDVKMYVILFAFLHSKIFLSDLGALELSFLITLKTEFASSHCGYFPNRHFQTFSFIEDYVYARALTMIFREA